MYKSLITIAMLLICSFSFAEEKNPYVDGFSNQERMEQLERWGALVQQFKDDRKENYTDNFYLFISFSMSTDIIKKYLKQAKIFGAKVVIKGIPPNTTLRDFILNVVLPLNKELGDLSPGITISPELFDVYDVKLVPTFVLSKSSRLDICKDKIVKEGRYVEEKTIKGKSVKVLHEGIMFKACDKTNQPEFIKVAGTITFPWVLNAFADNGFTDALKILDRVRNYSSGKTANPQPPSNEQLFLKSMKEAYFYNLNGELPLQRKGIQK